jgi:hypothetical protein
VAIIVLTETKIVRIFKSLIGLLVNDLATMEETCNHELVSFHKTWVSIFYRFCGLKFCNVYAPWSVQQFKENYC